jgi:ATP-dependent Clp protease ATP-binding subunit ClpX
MSRESELRCSFCNKSPSDVQRLIRAGNTSVAICNECVDVCNDVIADAPVRPATSDEYEAVEEPTLFPFICPGCGHRWRVAIPRER